MAKKQDGRDTEMEALMSIEGVDSAKIAEQIRGKSEESPATPPANPPVIPPIAPPAAPPVPPVDPKNVPDPEAIRTAMLHEMWGDQFTTVEDFKKANIPASLQELTTLRQKTQDLETQLSKKPKHNFATDEIAKYNEFAKETGIKNEAIFNKINGADVANMSDIDALALLHVIENPRFASFTPQEVQKYFERKYNVDKAKVEAGDLTEDELRDNLMDVSIDAEKAKTKLQELKGKIKMPEIPVDGPDPKKWTPEIEAKQKTDWQPVNVAMLDQFKNLAITPKGWKTPIANFVLPEEDKEKVMQTALDYIISNQMEVNQVNVKSVAQAMYDQIRLEHQEEIYQIIADRARSMSEEEFLKAYNNSAAKNTDTPPPSGVPSTEEEQRKKAYEMETKR